ncbi:hypothetical protein AWB69_04200 [Caballeronia udeis]|uniref:Uncharacterized protein n=1 Tax=Caballeronia udeis TaxID=1232866 RepID=A0A158HBN0_9BURK|nr:hypothetical protein AWB69_04200 [Caballeronia udeis]
MERARAKSGRAEEAGVGRQTVDVMVQVRFLPKFFGRPMAKDIGLRVVDALKTAAHHFPGSRQAVRLSAIHAMRGISWYGLDIGEQQGHSRRQRLMQREMVLAAHAPGKRKNVAGVAPVLRRRKSCKYASASEYYSRETVRSLTSIHDGLELGCCGNVEEAADVRVQRRITGCRVQVRVFDLR